MAELLTPPGIITWPNLLKPHPKAQGSQELVYDCSLLFSPQHQNSSRYQAMVAAVDEMIASEFPKERRSSLTLPFRSADDKAGQPGYQKGWSYITPKSKFRPNVLDENGEEIDPHDLDAVWPGQKVIVFVKPYAWSNSGKHGISFNLNDVKIIDSTGPRLDGRGDAKKKFAAAEEESADMPL